MTLVITPGVGWDCRWPLAVLVAFAMLCRSAELWNMRRWYSTGPVVIPPHVGIALPRRQPDLRPAFFVVDAWRHAGGARVTEGWRQRIRGAALRLRPTISLPLVHHDVTTTVTAPVPDL